MIDVLPRASIISDLLNFLLVAGSDVDRFMSHGDLNCAGELPRLLLLSSIPVCWLGDRLVLRADEGFCILCVPVIGELDCIYQVRVAFLCHFQGQL